MSKNKIIYDITAIDAYKDDTIKRIGKAVIASAIKVRDRARAEFANAFSQYKYGTSKYYGLAKGINIGKYRDGKIRVHALGSKEIYDTYKTRFFVGGTSYREQRRVKGKTIKPYTKGYLKNNDAIDKGMLIAPQTLNNFIKNVLDN